MTDFRTVEGMILEHLVIPASKEAFKDCYIHVIRPQEPIEEASIGERFEHQQG